MVRGENKPHELDNNNRQSKENAMLKKWILIFSLLLSLGLVWAQVNIIPTRTDVSGFPDWTDTNVVGTTYLQLLVADANTVSPAMNFDNYTSETLDFKARTFGGTNTVENEITVSISTNNGSTWTVLGTRLPLNNTLVNMEQFDLSAYSGSQVRIKFSVAGTNNSVGAGIDYINIRGVASAPVPALTVTPATLSGFTYEENSGPSAEQSFTVSGTDLDGNVSITAPANYEISLASGSGFTTTLNVNHSGGTVTETTIYVRLVAGLAVGLYNNQNVSITAGTALPKSVTLNGSVTAEPIEGGYLVNFEGPGETKTAYASATINLSGLNWDMTDALIGIDTADWKNGIRSARMRGYGTSSMTMLTDKTGGLGTLSFQYRRYGTAAQVDWKVELSTDGGSTWTQVGEDFTAPASDDVQTFSEVLNVAGNVRIRIKRATESGTSNRQMNIDDILLTDYSGAATPTIYATGTFTDFSTFTGTPSASQSYSLSGANLSANISITAPAGFQVSTDDISFGPSTSVASDFNGTIYVRLSGASAGNFSGNIAHTSTGADPVNLAVSGTVQNPAPTITLTGTLNNFNTTPGTPSATQSYTVEGVYLSGNISIAAPTGFEISLSQTEGFTGSLQLTPASGIVAVTSIYVRMTGAEAGAFSGDISHSSTGATTQNMAVNGNVATAPTATVLLRPAQISIADATHQSAVLVQVENYPSDDFRYRLYNGGNQYYPWRADTGAWISSTAYSAGPQIPGTPSSSVSWWIPFQRGNNNTTIAYYRDRQGPSYGTPNFQTVLLPDATAITTPVPILDSQVNFNTWNDYTQKYIVLAYDASETLIAASSTDLDNGDFIVYVEDGTTITRIEIRDVMNNLIEAVTGTWPQVLNQQIIISGSIDPLFNVAGQPSEEYGSYTVTGQDLTENISVLAPTHFEIALDTNGPWSSTLSLPPSFDGTVYVRHYSSEVGEHSGNITHNSAGATEATIRVEGETLAPQGEIVVNSTMTPFYQEVGTPSVAQSYSISSIDLSDNIMITTSAPFELSQNGSSGWATEINVPTSYNGLIWVRLNATEVGTHSDVEITHSNANSSPVTINVSGTVNIPAGPLDNIFFSEYIEGASNNKALEIFNASDVTVDLSRYKVELYSNGATTAGNTLILSGTLAPGEVYVIAHASAAAEILAVSDVTSTVTFFNGDDALALRCLNPDTIIDVFGEIGVDPGNGWTVAGVANATVDKTLIRKPTVTTGNLDWAAQFGTDAGDSEWIVMPVGTHQYLGSHTYNPGGNPLTSAPVFDPPAGAYVAPINVSLTSSTAGATIRYTTDGSDPSPTVGTIYASPIAISASTTIRAIAYADGYDPSIVVEAVYAYPTPISDIATLRAQPTGSSNVYTLTGEAVLTYQNANRNTKYIQDDTAAIVIDDNGGIITSTYNLYDGITGITGYLNVYSQLIQFVPVADPGAASSSNNEVVPEVRTLASLTPADQAKLIKVNNVTITGAATFPATAQNLTATDGTATLTLRTFVNTDYAGTDVPTDPVTLTCLVGQYNATMQIGHRFLSDIQISGGQLASPELSITLEDGDIVLTWNDIDGAASYRIESADDPYGTFTEVTSTTQITHSIPASAAKKFYRVIAQP